MNLAFHTCGVVYWAIKGRKELGTTASGDEGLRWLLEYEVAASARNRRFMSVVMVHPGPVENRRLETDHLEPAICGALRSSDRLFALGNNTPIAIVMGDTPLQGAITACKRYVKEFAGRADLRCSISSYPRDGVSIESLLETAERRLAMAEKSTNGTVLWSG